MNHHRWFLVLAVLSASSLFGADDDFQPKQDMLPVPPPEKAIVLFDGAEKNRFLGKDGKESNWKIEEGVLISSRDKNRANHIVSQVHFRDADIHAEFNVDAKASGNSGLYIHGNYEMQIFNSHGKQEPNEHDEGSLYGFAKPLVNAARPPGEWQVYDIRYRAPRRDEADKITEEGSITAWLNGQKVQDGVRFGEPKSVYHPYRYVTTPYLKAIWELQKKTSVGPLFLQDHDSPCRFRNVWILPLDDQTILYKPEPDAKQTLRILPLGDSITRGSYLAKYESGPFADKSIGLPHAEGGGYRKPLQDKLRAAGIAFDFVGDLNYGAFGENGKVDPAFDPDHHGAAGFSNAALLKGGPVPTPEDVLGALQVKEVKVPGIVQVLEKHKPDVILLMSGANGFDAAARDKLILALGKHSTAHIFVATIPPQKEPRAGWEKVGEYNASLSDVVAARTKGGDRITLVDIHAAVSPDDLLPDGVHPNKAGMEKIAEAWFQAIQASVAKTEAD